MPLIIIEHHHHYPNSESSTLTPLLQHMMESLMAQLDDLMTVLTAIHGDVTSVLERAKSLQDQLTTLQQTTPPQVDLQPAIDAAASIRDALEGTVAATGSASGATDAEAQQLGEEAAATNDTSGSADGGAEATVSDTAGADVVSSDQPEDATSAPNDPAAGTQPTA